MSRRNDERDVPAHRERSGSGSALWIVLALVGFFAVVGVAGVAAVAFTWRSGRVERERVLDEKHALADRAIADRAAGNVSADREGQTWTHSDLLTHLNAHGMTLRIEKTEKGGLLRGPAAVLVPTGTEYNDDFPLDLQRIVFVEKLKDTPTARDEAGADPAASFAWGRFLFSTRNPRLSESILQSLGMGR